VGFHVWPINFAQAETNAMLRYLGVFASRLTSNFQVTSGVLRRGDISELVNNIHLLLMTFLIYCLTHLSELATQNTVLIQEHCAQNFCLCCKLGELTSAVGKNEISKQMIVPLFLDRSQRSMFVASHVSQNACI
jgi:hypothetical protein